MDEVQERRPSFLNCRVVQNKVRDVIVGDQRLTVRELAEKCWISKTTLHDILSKYSNMNRVCARRVLRLLTTENLEKRVELSRQFIKKLPETFFFGQHCQNWWKAGSTCTTMSPKQNNNPGIGKIWTLLHQKSESYKSL